MQVTCEYAFRNGATVPKRVHTIVVSTQHSNDISLVDVRSQIMDKVIRDVVPARYLDENTIFHINPCGPFTEGGPMVRGASLGSTTSVLFWKIKELLALSRRAVLGIWCLADSTS